MLRTVILSEVERSDGSSEGDARMLPFVACTAVRSFGRFLASPCSARNDTLGGATDMAHSEMGSEDTAVAILIIEER